MIYDIMTRIKNKFPMLLFKVNSLSEDMMDIGNAVIEETAAGGDISMLLEDTMYNGL